MIWSRSTPSQGGLGWNLGYGGGASRYQQADLTWRMQNVQLQGGLYGETGNYTRWADLSGSLVWMDNAVFASNRINDAFVLVSTKGYPQVPIRYENQLMGSTDDNGHLLVPWVAAYYPAKFQIEPLDLPANVSAPEVEQRVAVRQGSGLLLDFPIRCRSRRQHQPGGRARRTAAAGQPEPKKPAAASAPALGWDGQVYFEGLQSDNQLRVVRPDGRACQARFPPGHAQTHRQPGRPADLLGPDRRYAMSRHSTSACLLGFATLCASPLLLAACTTSSGTGNFGSLSSFTVASTAQTITGTTGSGAPAACCRSSAPTPSTRPSPAPPIRWAPRRGCTTPPAAPTCPTASAGDNGCGTVYNVGSTVRWSSTTFLGILGLFNATDGSLPLYLRTATGVTLPAGTYTDTIGLNWAWHLCAAGIGPVCVYDDGTASSSVNVTLTVPQATASSTALRTSASAAPRWSRPSPRWNQNIGVRCTLNATYTIGFDNGSNFSGGWRRMLSGANAIQYNLYKPGDSTVWTTSNTQAGTGSGAAQNVPYRAIVNPAQGNVPAGTYSDTVRVILTLLSQAGCRDAFQSSPPSPSRRRLQSFRCSRLAR